MTGIDRSEKTAYEQPRAMRLQTQPEAQGVCQTGTGDLSCVQTGPTAEADCYSTGGTASGGTCYYSGTDAFGVCEGAGSIASGCLGVGFTPS